MELFLYFLFLLAVDILIPVVAVIIAGVIFLPIFELIETYKIIKGRSD